MEFRTDPSLERVEVVVYRDGKKIVISDVLAYSFGDGDVEILDYERERIRDEVLRQVGLATGTTG